MTTSTLERAGSTRPRFDPAQSDSAAALHEFDLPPGEGFPIAPGHDCDETNGRGSWGRRCVWQRASGGPLRCVWD